MNYQIGHYNHLRILSFGLHGAMLDGGNEQILMPKKYLTPQMKEGDEVDVFVYLDQDDRPVATTEQAKAEVGQFAFLRVAWVNKYGAFLDWGLTKDLFVPYSEQALRMVKDASYLVFIYLDEKTDRIVATQKLERYLMDVSEGLEAGQKVNIRIWKQTEMGFKVVVNDRFAGLVYKNEIFQPLHIGDQMEARIKNVRPDGKLDIALQNDGKYHVDDFSEELLQALLATPEHFLPMGDHSPAEEIYDRFRVSKKTFKRALGALYKRKVIEIQERGIKLL